MLDCLVIISLFKKQVTAQDFLSEEFHESLWNLSTKPYCSIYYSHVLYKVTLLLQRVITLLTFTFLPFLKAIHVYDPM